MFLLSFSIKKPCFSSSLRLPLSLRHSICNLGTQDLVLHRVAYISILLLSVINIIYEIPIAQVEKFFHHFVFEKASYLFLARFVCLKSASIDLITPKLSELLFFLSNLLLEGIELFPVELGGIIHYHFPLFPKENLFKSIDLVFLSL